MRFPHHRAAPSAPVPQALQTGTVSSQETRPIHAQVWAASALRRFHRFRPAQPLARRAAVQFRKTNAPRVQARRESHARPRTALPACWDERLRPPPHTAWKCAARKWDICRSSHVRGSLPLLPAKARCCVPRGRSARTSASRGLTVPPPPRPRNLQSPFPPRCPSLRSGFAQPARQAH